MLTSKKMQNLKQVVVPIAEILKAFKLRIQNSKLRTAAAPYSRNTTLPPVLYLSERR